MMKRGLVFLIGSLLLAAIAFLISHSITESRVAGERGSHEPENHLPELDWLRHEFDLSATEFERVSALHRDYLPTCESLCAKIAAARGKVRELILEGTAVTPELEAALREEAVLRAECQVAMLRHLYVTAGALPPEKASAYLETMLPEVMAMTSEPTHNHRGH
jgi:hypothetical protein